MPNIKISMKKCNSIAKDTSLKSEISDVFHLTESIVILSYMFSRYIIYK